MSIHNLPPSLLPSFPPSLPACLPASCFKPKYNIYLLSTALEWIPQCIFQINMSISDLWHQPCNLNQLTWKPPRAWTLVSNWDVRPGCFPRASPPICLYKTSVFVPSTAEARKGTVHIFPFPPPHVTAISLFVKERCWFLWNIPHNSLPL